MPRRLALVLTVLVAACSKKRPSPIVPDPIDAAEAAISPVDLVVGVPDGSSLAGKDVAMVAIVGARSPPHALALGFVTVPLADGAIPATRAMPMTGHHKVRLTGRVLGTGQSARYAVDSVTPMPTVAAATSIAAILAHPDDYDERRVALVGTWSHGEEHSALDARAWLSGCAAPVKEPDENFRQRVKVEGWVYTRLHGIEGFGHVNAYRLHVEADRCELAP